MAGGCMTCGTLSQEWVDNVPQAVFDSKYYHAVSKIFSQRL
jgi:hypothetical protein